MKLRPLILCGIAAFATNLAVRPINKWTDGHALSNFFDDRHPSG